MTIEQYVTRLRWLASSCDYGTLTEGVIRNRLVLAVKDSARRARMFRKPDLTLNEAIHMCRIAETSQIQLQLIGATGLDEDPVHFMKQGHHKSRTGQKSMKQKSQQQSKSVNTVAKCMKDVKKSVLHTERNVLNALK